MLTRRTPMKRTPFRSKTSVSAGARNVPLARNTGIRKFREEPRRSSRTIDVQYLARVRTLPCCADGLPGHVCRGRIVAHHAGRHAAGMKCSDLETIPICDAGHRELHDHTGCFRDFTGEEVRSWEDGQIAVTQRRLGVATDSTTV